WMATFGTRFRAFQAGAQYRYHDVRPDAAGLVALAELVESGQLRPFVREVFSLDDAEVALKKSAFRHGRGKMVIDLTI
ncbi:MAG TPA: hypothetical protein EYP98_07635, partial [Planctomycetes bacterium]|nr:hypothetical protein [Planctomycetota bacterium]